MTISSVYLKWSSLEVRLLCGEDLRGLEAASWGSAVADAVLIQVRGDAGREKAESS